MNDVKPSRLVRLVAIQTMLRAKQLLTAREVAAKFDVSLRTVYRDMRALEQAGVPLYTEEGQGYRLVDGYSLPPVALSEREANALVTAEQLVSRNKDASFVRDYAAAMTKIKAVLHRATQEKAELLAQRVVFRNNPQQDSSSDTLAVLQLAITHRTPVEITYQAIADRQETRRTVEPLALYSTQENWVLIARCRLRSGYRSFRLDNIQKLTPLAEVFADRNFDLAVYFADCRKKFLPPDTGLSPTGTRFGFSHQTPVEMNQVTIDPFIVVGISARTSNQNGQAARDIAAIWNRFLGNNLAARIPNKTSEAIYSVYTDYAGDHTQPYTVLLGCCVSSADEVPDGMVAKHFPGGMYQSLVAQGSIPQGVVYQAWTDIWNSELDRAYTADFEVYGEKALNPEDAEVDIYIAVNG
jgi:predicted DNA-binding transcriptional regulator YafY/predicted transcriptional regulator YdeE